MTLHSLPIFVRLTDRAVVLVGDGEAADAKRRLLERAGARIVDEDATDAALAIVVDDDAAVARLKARGLLVNVVDRPDLCDFTLPAIVERGDVLVAVGTGGVSAGLAAALRQRLEALLPAGLGTLAKGLQAARGAMRTRWSDGGDRRRAIGAALAPGGPLDPLGDPIAVERWLADAGTVASRVEAVHVTDDPDALTLRDARLFALADRVHHAADVSSAVLDRARADAVRVAAPVPATTEPGLTLWVERRR
ncbi:siroheme synthase [Sphingomonas sp. Leaf33]|uniref:precorrin-2 dehydrogenase/sirohydrochlorin ferrochelatase family protein n=1 Tax=Sphingomonas sp. Leaf33 TaxID=1736215 RepID=UPI0006FD5461|nr:bifunctional precorrin-2 dehydrogenase/sirohydrochlorin ferrochelatase [Sphingomonas sp. Leaf33]KQN24865.1 siroheme synthase [Sphingomonas sp. Leaf33]